MDHHASCTTADNQVISTRRSFWTGTLESLGGSLLPDRTMTIHLIVNYHSPHLPGRIKTLKAYN